MSKAASSASVTGSGAGVGMATVARGPGQRRRSKSRMKLEVEDLPSIELLAASSPPAPAMASTAANASSSISSGGSQRDANTVVIDPALELRGPEWRYEPMLRNAVHTLLQETSHDDGAFAFLRQVCTETLAHKHRASVCSSATAESLRGLHASARKSTTVSSTVSECDESVLAGRMLLSAPKSPQERLLALVPNAIEKGKRTYQRRASPNATSSTAMDETSRWQKLDADDAAPITELTVIFTGDTVPDGFTKLERSASGLRADLNKGGRGVFVYLCQSRDRSADKLPISEIIAIFPERGEFVPTDYEVVQRRGAPANLNTGTQGEKIFLCYKRSATSSIVDVMVLFPKKGEKPPYSYMKVDRTPDGHIADLNMNSGGTEVCLCYKKKLSSLSELHVSWLHATVSAREQSDSSVAMIPAQLAKPKAVVATHAAVKAGKPPTGAPLARKASEVRETHPASPSAAATTKDPIVGADAPFTWQDTQAYYLFPLLLACYTRHGAAAEAALQGLSQCLDAGMFDDDATAVAASSRFEVIIDAVASICHQGVKSRFALALPFFRKVIRKCAHGFAPAVLHAVLKSVTFIGDFDSLLVKAVEDELVDNVMGRYDTNRCEATLASSALAHIVTPRSTHEIAREFVEHLVDDVSTGVEIAKMTEMMLGIFKSHSSIHSPTFCTDLAAAMSDSIASVAERNALQLVITLSKAVHRKTISASEHGADRDHLAIINSLRALNVALLAAGAATKEDRVFGQVVRRFVFTTVNSIVLIWSTDVFRATLTLVSTLWNHYRRHLKVELALLFEHVFLRLLRTSAVCAAPHQMDILHELTPWIQLPHNVVEIFVNFDLDRVQQWKIFEFFCSTLCSLAEGSTHPGGTLGGGGLGGGDERDDTALHLQVQAINAILAIARSVMDASGHAHLISRDARTRHLSMETGGWEQDEGADDDDSAAAFDLRLSARETPSSPLSVPSSPATIKGASGGGGDKTAASGARTSKFGSISVRMRNELQKRNQQFLKRAMEISSSKSLKKAIEYLVAMNFVKESPRDVTSFLRIYHDFFDEAEIGDYLGEGDEDFKVQVRLSYVRAISFKGMTLVESLRHFLTNGGFRLPGEAQKIERMVEAFAQCYWEDAPTSFSSADTAMIIAYSIIMLNTDLHNPQVKKNKMSKEQFVKNNRGIDSGRDLPKRFLEEIYDDIAHNAMHLKGARFVTPPSTKARETSSLELDNEKFRVGLAKSVAQFEELLKDLSASYYTFHFVGVDTCISPDLIKLLFERVWFYLLALSTSILCDNQSDLSMTMHCLDLLRFNISTCLFLDMPVERQAFCNLLFKVQSALEESALPGVADNSERENSTNGSSSDLMADAPSALTSASSLSSPVVSSSPQTELALTPAPVDEARVWIASIENAAATDDPWRVMGDIHLLVNKMKDTIARQQKSEALNSVLKRISRSHVYIKGTTQFIREGDLVKKCRSRNQLYRFFLFSDQLLYADKSLSGYWNPHNSLRLKLTRIADVPDSVLHKHAFQIHNPEKSFVVYAESAYAKAEWMRLIEDAIAETAQKVKNNARRLSTQPQSPAAPQSSAARATVATGLTLDSNAGALAPPSSPATSVVASASSAMKVLMRRSTRVSSPTNGSATGAASSAHSSAAQCDDLSASPSSSRSVCAAAASENAMLIESDSSAAAATVMTLQLAPQAADAAPVPFEPGLALSSTGVSDDDPANGASELASRSLSDPPH